jgi:hypothetical protein
VGTGFRNQIVMVMIRRRSMSLISEDTDPSELRAAARPAAATSPLNRVTFNRRVLNRIYRIEKDPRLARKQGMYSVISATGLILRRGHELDRVLLVIDRKLAVV